MTSKEYLHKVWMAPIRLKELEQEEQDIKEDILHLSATDYSVPRVSGGGCGGDTSDKIVRYMDARDKATTEWDYWINLRIQCREIIMGISCGEDTEIYQTVLKYRYLGHMQWEEIAVRMGYSYRRVTQIHCKALRAFEKSFERFPIISYG